MTSAYDALRARLGPDVMAEIKAAAAAYPPPTPELIEQLRVLLRHPETSAPRRGAAA